MYGMEERREELPEHTAFRIFVENIHANAQLVRPIACEWLRQHPNGTYADFLAQHNGRLPVRFMRAVWQGIRELRLITRTNLIAEIVGAVNRNGQLGSSDCHFYAQRNFFCLLNDGTFNKFCADENSIVIGCHLDASECWCSFRNKESSKYQGFIGRILDNVMSRLLNVISRLLCDQQPLLVEVINFSENSSQHFYDGMKELLRQAHIAHSKGGFVVVIFVRDRILDFIIANQGTIVSIPSMIIPDGSTDDVVQQIVQDAIAVAIEQQPGNLHTIDDAFRHLTERR